VLVALALALGGCAGPRAGLVRLSATRRAAGSAPVVRARFQPAEGDAVFERAVRAAALEGYRISRCDPDSRRLETARIELDAPCGATTCLARQRIQVALGYRQARVIVAREVYDGAAKAWRASEVVPSAEAARELLDRIVSPKGLAPRGAACAAAERVEVSSLSPTAE
jgi:hypothetical protein